MLKIALSYEEVFCGRPYAIEDYMLSCSQTLFLRREKQTTNNYKLTAGQAVLHVILLKG